MGVIDGTVEKIKQMIVQGEVRPGDKLPVEKDLAELLGVSRNTLREAVRALVAMRVLQTRQGDGTYVTSLSPGLLLDGMAFVSDMHHGADAQLFLHVRRLLEPEATALAATRVTSDDLCRLDTLLTRAEVLAERPAADHDALVAIDQEFHALITSRCGNPVLAAVIDNLSGRTVRARVWRGMTEPGAIRRTLTEHRAIYRALAAGDADRARLRAAVHILGVEDAMAAGGESAPPVSGGRSDVRRS
ncbi:GntR family transcriptional regulator [Sphaerisporangium rufum]|uniref:GntR family transcriptional regulator n=1 Tax=Sphaerisporangium rufum TaxID=1381558 RepID=A0A919V082_9ACTN|nr:FadR/GntR family transcriptional regulator [Sphaerisporangium rufum]GII77127.1 GntR family transcriptional regulator [Sphaerisporangium rufum]